MFVYLFVQFFWCVCVCMGVYLCGCRTCTCVCGCVDVWVCVCACTCVQRSKMCRDQRQASSSVCLVIFTFFFLIVVLFFFETGSLTGLELTEYAGPAAWWASGRPTCLHQGSRHVPPGLTFSCGFWGWNSCLHSERFADQTLSPGLYAYFLVPIFFKRSCVLQRQCRQRHCIMRMVGPCRGGCWTRTLSLLSFTGNGIRCQVFTGLTGPGLVLNAVLLSLSLSIRRPSCGLLVRCRLLATWSQAQQKCIFPATA